MELTLSIIGVKFIATILWSAPLTVHPLEGLPAEWGLKWAGRGGGGGYGRTMRRGEGDALFLEGKNGRNDWCDMKCLGHATVLLP
jgi:hypothetical protein